MHKVLVRQLKHVFGEIPVLSKQWEQFLETVGSTYDDFDRDRVLIERSLEISSTELKGIVALLQATLDSINEGILVIDQKGKVINHNKRFVDIWQFTPDVMKTSDNEKIITSILDKVAISDSEIFKKNINGQLDMQSESRTFILKFKDGRTVEMSSSSQLVEHAHLGKVWSFRDITSRLKTEEESQARFVMLERLNKAMINRELKMVELKAKIRVLEQKKGQKD